MVNALLPSDLAARIREEHRQFFESMNRGLEHALAAGQLLIAAKEQIKHGEWLGWLEEHCEIDERLAQKYMRVAREMPKLAEKQPANTPRVADLSFRQALDLVAANAHTARKIKPEALPEVLENTAQQKIENMTDAHEKFKSRGKIRRAREKA